MTKRLDMRDTLLRRPREHKEPKPRARRPKTVPLPPPPLPYATTATARNGMTKTGAMILVELALRMPIEQAIKGSLSVAAKRTGMVASTVSKWKKRLELS